MLDGAKKQGRHKDIKIIFFIWKAIANRDCNLQRKQLLLEMKAFLWIKFPSPLFIVMYITMMLNEEFLVLSLFVRVHNVSNVWEPYANFIFRWDRRKTSLWKSFKISAGRDFGDGKCRGKLKRIDFCDFFLRSSIFNKEGFMNAAGAREVSKK